MKIFWFIPTHGDSRYLGSAIVAIVGDHGDGVALRGITHPKEGLDASGDHHFLIVRRDDEA